MPELKENYRMELKSATFLGGGIHGPGEKGRLSGFSLEEEEF